MLLKSVFFLWRVNKIVSDDKELSSVFNTYLNTITNTLSIPKWNAEFTSHSIDHIAIAIEKHSSHPSILKIKEKFHTDTCFSFTEVSSDQTLSGIRKLKRKERKLVEKFLSRNYK